MYDEVLGYALYEVNNGEKTFYLYQWHVEHNCLAYYKAQTGYAIRKLKKEGK